MKVTNQPASSSQIIENKPAERSPGAATRKNTTTGIQSNGSLPGATVEISENARWMRQASDLAKAGPDVRADKVASIKKAVQSGTYKVDAQQIADKLVDEHLGTDFGKNNL